jgi:uncharacterized C2H2 Zn-finger protein
MPSHFTVECPRCHKDFPVHTELWEAPYDLLCPFCGNTFRQRESPHVVSADGEVRRIDTGSAERM